MIDAEITLSSGNTVEVEIVQMKLTPESKEVESGVFHSNPDFVAKIEDEARELDSWEKATYMTMGFNYGNKWHSYKIAVEVLPLGDYVNFAVFSANLVES